MDMLLNNKSKMISIAIATQNLCGITQVSILYFDIILNILFFRLTNGGLMHYNHIIKI